MNNRVLNKMTKAALAALLAGAPFAQSLTVLAKEKDPEPETDDYDFPEDYDFSEDYDDDFYYWDSDYTFNENNYDWVDDYKTLTKEEKEKVKEVMKQIDELYDEMLEYYDFEGYVIDEKKIEELEKKEEKLWDSIADITEKMDEEDTEKGKEYLEQFLDYSDLTEEEKEEYKDIMDQIFELGKDIEGLIDDDDNIDEKKLEKVIEKLSALLGELGVLDFEITEGDYAPAEDGQTYFTQGYSNTIDL